MIPIIYVSFLLLMLIVLWRTGKDLKRDYRILSLSGILALAVYTLNEGLRFGRGIDYMVYWSSYNQMEQGWEIDKDILYVALSKLMINCGIPYQGEIMLMSFIFILSLLLFLRHFKDTAPLTIPLFVLFSLLQVENMVRWYLGFSFILIGLSYLLDKNRPHRIRWYVFFSIVAILFHYGLFIIPILYYLISLRRTPLLHPIVTLVLFFGIYFLFEASFMLSFVEVVEAYGQLYSWTESYASKADYWLTSGFSGMGARGVISMTEMLSLSLLVVVGHRCVKMTRNENYVYAYNLFIVGLLLYPISKKVELVIRFAQVFFFFRAIILSLIVYMYVIKRRLIAHEIAILVVGAVFLKYIGDGYFIPPISGDNTHRYMYVWNKGNNNVDGMVQKYHDERYKALLRTGSYKSE